MRDRIIQRISLMVATIPVIANTLFRGVPLVNTLLTECSVEQLLDIYEQVCQSYWRSILVCDENYRFECAPYDLIERDEFLSALDKLKLPSAQLDQVMYIVANLPPAKRKTKPAVNLHEQNILKPDLPEKD